MDKGPGSQGIVHRNEWEKIIKRILFSIIFCFIYLWQIAVTLFYVNSSEITKPVGVHVPQHHNHTPRSLNHGQYIRKYNPSQLIYTLSADAEKWQQSYFDPFIKSNSSSVIISAPSRRHTLQSKYWQPDPPSNMVSWRISSEQTLINSSNSLEIGLIAF